MKKFFFLFIILPIVCFAQTITPIASIQDSLSVYEGQNVTIQGIVTIGDGLLYPGKTQFYVQDNSGRGIQIFDHTPLVPIYVRGDLIEVSGEVGLYTGSSNQYFNVQINDPVVNLISQGEDQPNPHLANGYEELVMNGTWANAYGEIIGIWDSPYGFYQITIDVNGFEMDLQFWDSTGANVEEYTDGDVILAHGVIAFYEETLQLSCAYEEDIDYYQGGDITPPQMVSVNAMSSNTVQIAFSEQIDQTTAETISNFAIDNGLTVESAELQANQSYVTLTTSEQTAGLNYTITVNNIEDLAGNAINANSTIQFSGYEPVIYDQIADIQNNLDDYLGQAVTVRAVVTIGDDLLYLGKTQFYLQDESGRGIQVFDHTPLPTTYIRGDLLEVTGEIDLYTGNDDKYYNVQLTDPVVTLITQGNELPEPYEATGYEDFTLNGTWASATGEIVDIWDADEYGFYQITVSVDGFEMTLQFWDSTGANVEQYVEGDEITAHGIVAFYETVPQLSCAYEEDVDYYIDDIYEDINLEYPVSPGDPVTIGFPYDDPVNSIFLHWKRNKDLDYITIEMDTTLIRETEYFATIPGQSAGIIVKFYITVTDTMNNEIIYPEAFPAKIFQYDYPFESFKAKLNIPPKPFNPYNGETFPIEIATKANSKAILKIYNAEGKLFVEPLNTITSTSGIIEYNWNGKDKDGKLVPIGLYICYLEVIDPSSGRKKTAKAPIVVGVPLR